MIINNFQNKFKILFLIFTAISMLFLGSCKSKPKVIGDSGIEVESKEGWLNDSTYQMWVYGEWDRDRYYIEGEEEDLETSRGKTPKSIFGIREDSKTAAKVKAMRNFKEKMISEVQSETQVENSKLVSDIIESSLSGVTIAPESIREQYSERGDANILFNFKADDLRQYVENAIKETVQRYKEETQTE